MCYKYWPEPNNNDKKGSKFGQVSACVICHASVVSVVLDAIVASYLLRLLNNLN